MFRRAMTLLQTRCTSMKHGLDPDDIHVPFGVQVPKYIYVTQEKPLPMEPLKVDLMIFYIEYVVFQKCYKQRNTFYSGQQTEDKLTEKCTKFELRLMP